ncbi:MULTISPECIES: coenzyme F390 synthetase [unclassified Methanoregula]|uniref:coenzyme F390 synthetase n=1 Tax=unclassified Methanoregula TaxID=2649730 RepID=UPI0009D20FD9|nr:MULTISPECIES: coenzyme F390 synthetase [unclassified Methanoregula]OPX61725.1 MAG: long-chain-fatty-acid--CoA ligase [Methanoregula sp. PtaB.Bin085]OPY33966.1 MAG: long-chain-fatty-acid--CoA ligase [Methanoregula sp. PtaU1.Bin006]
MPAAYFSPEIETMERSDLDALIDERVRYTVHYAAEHSPFYRHWFRQNRIDPTAIRVHEDLLELPLISGKAIREHQPPVTPQFEFLSAEWSDIFSIQETSGTSGTPKGFFLTWDDWKRYAEKYCRSFVSQGFTKKDRIVVCASYGMNVGANTMTIAAQKLGMGIIPVGKCSFDSRILRNYRPTSIVGSVFKLLRLWRRISAEGIKPGELSIDKLVAGGESFADESRKYLADQWECPVYNTYGSTEGTMCGECTELNGLHVPEDLVHLDVYDPRMQGFVKDGECGRGVLTTLLPVGGKSGMLLLNYDTEDTTLVLSRERCGCGRTHMRIFNPQREAETAWISGTALNRVDIETAVFQPENMEYLSGEYEAFIHDGEAPGEVILRISVECLDLGRCDRRVVQDTLIGRFLKSKPGLAGHYSDGDLKIIVNMTRPGGLELHTQKGRPKRLVDRREHA